jgi:peptidyl-prolyl cis-trans isomerase SurA
MPVKSTIDKKIGFTSLPEKNVGDDSYSFIYVSGVFDKVEQRSFEDARGLVMNDYQQLLEKDWLADLKKKYTVKVNEAVWNTVQ